MYSSLYFPLFFATLGMKLENIKTLISYVWEGFKIISKESWILLLQICESIDHSKIAKKIGVLEWSKELDIFTPCYLSNGFTPKNLMEWTTNPATMESSQSNLLITNKIFSIKWQQLGKTQIKFR